MLHDGHTVGLFSEVGVGIKHFAGVVLMAGEQLVAVPWKAWGLIAAVIAPMLTAAYFIGTVVPKVSAAYAHAQVPHAQDASMQDIGEKLDALTILLTKHIGEAEVIKGEVRHLDSRMKRLER